MIGEGVGLFLLPAEMGGLSRSFREEVILGTFASRFLAHPALRQKQFQSERLALVVSGLAHGIRRHYDDDTEQQCAAVSWAEGG